MTRPGIQRRDYGLLGPEGQRASESGLVSAVWYSPPVSRKRLGELMKKRNGPALRDTAIWFAALIVSGSVGVWLWGSWLAIVPFAIYGVLYGSAGDSRWHECGHGTAFKTRWMNDGVYQIACFMMLREPRVWRSSHSRHHADTIIVGRDPEINSGRPPDFLGLALNLFALKGGVEALGHIVLHATGRLTAEEKSFIAHRWWPQVYRIARIWLAILLGVIAACVELHSILPAMLVGLPTFYGGFLTLIFGLTQHAGLAEDVLDHRLNSRTVYMNPVSRFIYWNMNYHLEHHLFPMVPYHALPELHELVKPHCPAPYRSLIAAYREIVPTLWRQGRDPTYCVERTVPPLGGLGYQIPSAARPTTLAVSWRLIWALAGVPLTYALIVRTVNAVLARWPHHGDVLVLALVTALVLCIYTGARSVFGLLSWSTPARIAICVVYAAIAFFVLSFVGFISAF